jgi:hypothetical protein
MVSDEARLLQLNALTGTSKKIIRETTTGETLFRDILNIV